MVSTISDLAFTIVPRSVGVAALMLGLSVALTVPHALAKPFWHDEIYTILVSTRPSFDAMWVAALNGVDLSPPLSVWLTHLVHRVAAVGPVTTRMPALCGFYLAVLAVFFLLRTRVGTAGASSGALLLFFTAAPRYAAEARGYGLMMGLFASVLFLWMESAAGRRRRVYVPLLAIALAASIWNHYYGVLAFAPVLAGETARLVRRRRLDLPIAAAVGTASLSVLPLLPLMRVASAQRHAFWVATAPGEHLVQLHRFLIQPLLDAPVLLGVIVLALVISRLPLRGNHVTTVHRQHESVAVAVALAVPFLGFLLGRALTGGLAPRYILSGAVAFSIAVPMALTSRGNRNRVAEFLLLGPLLAFAAANAVQAWYPARAPLVDPVLSRPVLIASLRQPAPTVISANLQFLPTWYYTPPALRSRLRYLASPEQALRWTGSDTIDRGYLALARTVSLPVTSFEAFTRDHREFRVYENGSGWLRDALGAAGATVELTATEPGGSLYAVRMPDPAVRARSPK